MKRVKIKKIRNIIYIIGSIFIGLCIIGTVFVNIGLKSVEKISDPVIFEVKKNTSRKELITELKDAGIIKSKYASIIYVYVKNMNLKAGTYKLDRADSSKEIFKKIASNDVYKETIKVTFIEGKRLTDYAKVISEKFGYEEKEILDVLQDKEYAKSLISKYDILTEEILDENIKYPLEGYLFADTYEFYKDDSIKRIIEKMISGMSNKLMKVKDNIKDSSLTVHELLSISSIVELEANSSTDRSKVAQVLFKRLDKKVALGCDVTTYYAVDKQMGDVLTKKDVNSENPYNTRNLKKIGLIPGPICTPSFESITAALNPSQTNYEWFLADLKTGKVTFYESYDAFVNAK